ncbi:MAG: hypothetical protein Q8P12_03835, partial [bacterium]|nr:hypothetical protein [bacterium]
MEKKKITKKSVKTAKPKAAKASKKTAKAVKEAAPADKQELVELAAVHGKDTGSPEVQIALLSR